MHDNRQPDGGRQEQWNVDAGQNTTGRCVEMGGRWEAEVQNGPTAEEIKKMFVKSQPEPSCLYS